MTTKQRIVEVSWIDAVCESTELSIDDLPVLPRVKTFGILVGHVKGVVTIAAERLVNPRTGAVTYRSTTSIPTDTGMATRIRTVGYVDA